MQHLIRVYIVWDSSSSFQTWVLKWRCSNFGTSMVRSFGVQIFKVNMVISIEQWLYSICEEIHFSSQLSFLTLVLLNLDIPWLCNQCRSRSVGFWRSQLIWICTVCQYVNLYQQLGSSDMTGWKLEVGVASLFSRTRVNHEEVQHFAEFDNLKLSVYRI